MPTKTYIVFSMFCFGFLLSIEFAYPQEMGEIQNFGTDGRLYSLDQDDHYLLSRQSYGTEDSVGYQGQIRITKKYPGGGYAIETFDYIARCRAVDNNSSIATFAPGNQEEPISSVKIFPEKRPGSGLKNAYNLFWAACNGQFRKFR